MPSNLGGISGGLIGLVEAEVAEQFGSFTNLQTQITTNTTDIAGLKPKYMLLTQNNANSTNGTLTFTQNFNELTGILDYAGGTFTKTSAGSNYFLFNVNLTWSNGAANYDAYVKYTPNGGAVGDFMRHGRYYNSAIGTSFPSSFSFVIKMSQGDTLYVTSVPNYATNLGGYSQVTLLG